MSFNKPPNPVPTSPFATAPLHYFNPLTGTWQSSPVSFKSVPTTTNTPSTTPQTTTPTSTDASAIQAQANAAKWASLGYPQYAQYTAPDIPTGLKISNITEDSGGSLQIQYGVSDLAVAVKAGNIKTPVGYSLVGSEFQLTDPMAALKAGTWKPPLTELASYLRSVSFWTAQGFPEYAGKYNAMDVPSGYKIASAQASEGGGLEVKYTLADNVARLASTVNYKVYDLPQFAGVVPWQVTPKGFELVGVKDVGGTPQFSYRLVDVKAAIYSGSYTQLGLTKQQVQDWGENLQEYQGSVAFWTAQGHPEFAGTYAPAIIPTGWTIDTANLVKVYPMGPFDVEHPAPPPTTQLQVTFKIPGGLSNAEAEAKYKYYQTHGVSVPTIKGGVLSETTPISDLESWASGVASSIEGALAPVAGSIASYLSQKTTFGGPPSFTVIGGKQTMPSYGIEMTKGEALGLAAIPAIALVAPELLPVTTESILAGAGVSLGFSEGVSYATGKGPLSTDQAIETALMLSS